MRRAEELGKTLPDLPLAEYQALDSAFAEDLHQAISLDGALGDKDVIGGTAPRRVREEIQRLRELFREGK